MSIVLTDENFESEVSGAKKPVLVDFWMQGCHPCFLLSPILEKLAREFEKKIVFAKANLDDISLIAQKYGINAAPTMILFKEGKPVSGFIGLKPEETIRPWLEENLKEEGEESKLSSSPFAVARENEKINKLIQEVKEYAKKNGFFLNPNRKVVEGIVKSLLEREKKFGGRFCPCRRITENNEEDKKIICPCVYHLQELEKEGKCLCGLFVKNIIE
ncbi:MAG: thioredoxin domain-containing protein [Candidatus Nealsonbacteria bacterium]|nr:thioredoxin domain-containing protein [Candidatus Nealsonbacteria bacterium]